MCESCTEVIEQVAKATNYPAPVVGTIYNAIADAAIASRVPHSDEDDAGMSTPFEDGPELLSRPIGADPFILLRLLPGEGITETLAIEFGNMDDHTKLMLLRAALAAQEGPAVLADGTLIGERIRVEAPGRNYVDRRTVKKRRRWFR